MKEKLTIINPKIGKELKLPLYTSGVSAGFPSPADDYLDRQLDLNEHLITNAAATFFVRVSGDSMINAAIHPNDLLIVDKSLDATIGSIVIALINNEFTVKRFIKEGETIILQPENDNYKPIEIKDGMEFEIWGVVTNVIHSVR